MDEQDVARLLGDPAVIRNRRKIEAVIKNAGTFLEQVEDAGSREAGRGQGAAPTGRRSTPTCLDLGAGADLDVAADGWRRCSPIWGGPRRCSSCSAPAGGRGRPRRRDQVRPSAANG